MAVDQKPQDYKGPRTPIQLENPCGFCNASDHHMCMHELPYYEKLWICGCECNKGWKPIDLGGESSKRKRVKDEVRTVQLPVESRPDASASPASSDTVPESNESGSGDYLEEQRADGDPSEQEEGNPV
jgi:hypothetical protein